MRRTLIVWFAILASLLVVTVNPVAAATANVVISSNSTDTDFNNSSTLSNVAVTGSGSNAYIEPTGGGSDTTTYTTTGSHTYTVPSGVSSVTVKLWGAEGESTSRANGGVGGYVEGTLSVTEGETLDVKVGALGEVAGSDQSPDGGGMSDIRQGGSTLSDQVAVAGGGGGAGDWNDDDGSSGSGATAGGDGGPDNGEDAADAGPYGYADGGDGGTQSSGGAGGDGATYDNRESGTDGSRGAGGDGGDAESGGEYAYGGNGGQGYYGGGGGAAYWDFGSDVSQGGGGGGGSNYDDGLASVTSNQRGVDASNGGDGKVVIGYNIEKYGTYVSSTHSADNVQTGFTDLTFSGGSAEVTWLADKNDDGTFETTAASSTFSSDGNHTLDLSGTTSSKWRVNVTFSGDGKLHDEGVIAEVTSPSANNSTASPTGTVEDPDQTFSIDIDDPDFPTVQEDSVDVKWYLDGSQVATESITSNQTVSHSETGLSEGSHTWKVELSDSYGLTGASSQESITVENHAPNLKDGTASPAGITQNDEDATLSIDLEDGDFPNEGDSVDVEFFLDGSSVGTVTGVTSNQTVTQSVSDLGDGSHEWYAVATDQYGKTDTSSTFSFEVDHRAPEIKDGTASPTGTYEKHDHTFSIDVGDYDFAETSGDSVTVEFYLDGSKEDSTTISSNQTVSFTKNDLSGGSHSWHFEATDEYGKSTTGTTHNFEIKTHSPEFDNSTGSPTGEINSSDTTISIEVSDGDFQTGSDDETLTVEFYLDGSLAGSDTLNSNGTASHQITGLTGGDHTWHAIASDQWSTPDAQSQEFQFSTPDTLEIRNESAPGESVDNATVELRFYFEESSPTIIERNSSTGKINMTGLPVGEPFVVVADADSYVSRRIYVTSLTESQRVYLLPTSKPYVEQIFELQDYSGDFPAEDTVLLIQRGLNGSWQTVEGDFFGATGAFSARLRDEARHQLILINTETGVRRDVGDHVPISDGNRVVQVTTDGQVRLLAAEPTVSYDPSIRSLPATNSTSLAVELASGDSELTAYNVTWILTNKSGRYTLATETGQNGSGDRWEKSFDLRGSAGGNLTVVTNWTTAAGVSDDETAVYAITEYFANEYSLLNIVASVPQVVPARNAAMFTSFLSVVISVLVMLFVGGNLHASTESVAGAGIASLSFFGAVGWISWGVVFVAGFTAIATGAVRRGL